MESNLIWPPLKSKKFEYQFDENPQMVLQYDRGPIKNTNNEDKGIERD